MIQALTVGGAARSLIATAAANSGRDIRHRMISLESAQGQAVAAARQSGVEVIEQPTRQVLFDELEAADIVDVQFWNTPELYRLLTSPLPSMRLLLTCRVSGEHPPHVLTRELLEFADLTVVVTPYTARLPVVAQRRAMITFIPPSAGWDRVSGVRRQPHAGFNVGYIGTVDLAKMHPNYVAMSARVEVPDVRFIVCGIGDGFARLAREAAALGVTDRFEFRGYLKVVAPVLERLDVFGYPLCRENYSAIELVIQEAMYCAVPPVVMPYGGAGHSVAHGRTGLVASNENEYARAIEWLYFNPDERRRLGRAAAEHARASWDLEAVTAQWRETYERLALEPKRPRSWFGTGASGPRGTTPAHVFLQSLGDTAPEFFVSMTASDDDEARAADEEIAQATPVLASADSGGILHWRRRYPDDPWLRLWSGLVLAQRGRRALAAGEFHAALELGLDNSRVRDYLSEALGAAEASTT